MGHEKAWLTGMSPSKEACTGTRKGANQECHLEVNTGQPLS